MNTRPSYVTDYAIKQEENQRIFNDSAPLPSQYTFSAADAEVWLVLPWYKPTGYDDTHIVKLDNVTSLSLSSHRDHYPINRLGKRNLTTFTKGPKMVAGSIAFSNIKGSPFQEVIRRYQRWNGYGNFEAQFTSIHEVPPVNLMLMMINGNGDALMQIIKGMVFVDSGNQISMHNPVMDEVFSFMATDSTPLHIPLI